MSVDIATLSIGVDSSDVKGATRDLGGMVDMAGFLENALKTATAAFAAFKAASFIGDITQLAARYDTLGVVMRVVGNNAGYTGVQMEGLAQELQNQGISMNESRNTLTMMASAHIDLANATKLGRVAQDAAVIGNLNSSESFQRMIHGIQSGQTEVLRTIGLNVNFEESYKKLSRTLGKSVQDLTEIEKVHARTAVVMEKGKDIAGAYEESLGTVGKAAKSMERIWENLQVVMGSVFQPAFAVIVNELSSAMEGLKNWVVENKDRMDELGRAMGAAAGQTVGLVKQLIGIGTESAEAAGGVNLLTRAFQGIALLIAGVRDTFTLLENFWVQFIADMASGFSKLIDFMNTLYNALPGGMKKVMGVDDQFLSDLSTFNLKVQGIAGAMDDIATKKIAGSSSAFESVMDAIDPTTGPKGYLDAEAKRLAAGEARRLEEERLAGITQATELANMALLKRTELMKYENGLYEKNANARDKAADSAMKENNSLLAFIAELDPATAGTAQWVKAQEDLQWALTDEIITQDQYNQLLEVARGKFTEAGRAAESYAQKIKGDVTRMNSGNGGKDEMQYLEDLKAAGLDTDLYRQKMEKLRVEQLRLKAETGNTWAIIGQVVEQSASMATDKTVTWINATDGLARNWKSFGDLFKNIMRDMLVDMEKAILKQQLMQPLMSWASNGSNWAALWGSLSGATTMGGDGNMGPQPGVASSGVDASAFYAPSASKGGTTGGTSTNASIVVNVGTDGKASTSAQGQGGVELGKAIEGVVNEWAVRNSRPGGMLARA